MDWIIFWPKGNTSSIIRFKGIGRINEFEGVKVHLTLLLLRFKNLLSKFVELTIFILGFILRAAWRFGMCNDGLEDDDPADESKQE
jgi:hypothetical protein